jgi:hypothetical protein
MASLEWIELETLSREISEAELRLQAAEAIDSFDVARAIEREIAEMERHRGKLLAKIAHSVVGEQESTGASRAGNPGDLLRLAGPDPGTPGDAEPSAERDLKEGAETVWKQLTPADVEHARRQLTRQRAETLARHAEELQSLDTENAEVAALEQAINVFVRKYSGTGADVVALDLAKQPKV